MPSTTKPMSSSRLAHGVQGDGTMRSAMIDTPASTSSLITLFSRRTTPSTQSVRSDCRTATSAPSVSAWPMPPDAAMRRPATLRSFTCHIGSENDDRLAASESCSSGTRRLRTRAVGDRVTPRSARRPHVLVARHRRGSFADSSWQMRESPMRTCAATAHGDARIAAQIGVEVAARPPASPSRARRSAAG